MSIDTVKRSRVQFPALCVCKMPKMLLAFPMPSVGEKWALQGKSREKKKIEINNNLNRIGGPD